MLVLLIAYFRKAYGILLPIMGTVDQHLGLRDVLCWATILIL